VIFWAYEVSPGNHDISAAGVANVYDQYFPVSRTVSDGHTTTVVWTFMAQ
jgi:hypothetical protein